MTSSNLARQAARYAALKELADGMTDAELASVLVDPTADYMLKQYARHAQIKREDPRLPIENPVLRSLAAQMGITLVTDQQGKDEADTSAGVTIESRYFLGDVLILRVIGRNAAGNATFGWTVNGEQFTNPIAALRHADLLHRTGLHR